MTKKRVFGLFSIVMLMMVAAGSRVLAQTFSPLYSFNSMPPTSDPLGFPYHGTLAQGQDGNLYSTSSNGGSQQFNAGSVFYMSQTGGLSVLDAFDPTAGAGCSGPWSVLTLGSDGNFYGALISCPGSVSGEIFSVTPSGVVNPLYNFTGGADGGQPAATPIEGSDGNFYGTTLVGGGDANCGTIYQMTPAGALTTLHVFDRTNGCGNYAPLVEGNDGNSYGVTSTSGNNSGLVFTITPAGVYTVLFNFGGTKGNGPTGPLALGTDGNFYGTTQGGGVGNTAFGVVFKLTPAGVFKILHTFHTDSGDGYAPLAGLVQASDRYFYGVTSQGGTSPNCGNGINSVCGTIFRISSKAGSYATLYNFDGTTGASPMINLVQHTSGILYGLASFGGTYDSGDFYSLNAGLKPNVGLVSTSGAVGSTIGILGQGFTGTKKVTFTGARAAITVVSDTYITATVPSGARTGFVNVKTPTITLRSNKKFRVTP